MKTLGWYSENDITNCYCCRLRIYRAINKGHSDNKIETKTTINFQKFGCLNFKTWFPNTKNEINFLLEYSKATKQMLNSYFTHIFSSAAEELHVIYLFSKQGGEKNLFQHIQNNSFIFFIDSWFYSFLKSSCVHVVLFAWITMVS